MCTRAEQQPRQRRSRCRLSDTIGHVLRARRPVATWPTTPAQLIHAYCGHPRVATASHRERRPDRRRAGDRKCGKAVARWRQG
jgi:hypothetical protein